MKKRIVFLLLFALFGFQLYAQKTFPVNGTHHIHHNYYYFSDATIHVDYQTVIEKGSLIIRDGVIVAVGSNLEKPKGAVIFDLQGKHIYPSFIDPYSDYGMPKIEKDKKEHGSQMLSKKEGAYGWNQALKPETDAATMFKADNKLAEELRNAGFGAVLTHQKDGIMRGTSTGVLLSDNGENETMLSAHAAAHYSFKKGSSPQDYPSSLMGSIALIRQTYYDAEWYAGGSNKDEYNLTLEEFIANQSLPQIFEVSDYQSAMRADKIGDEFGIQYIIKGSGDEYKRINYIKSTNAAFILPVNFPKAYDVNDPYDALVVSLEDMKHWEMAPGNPGALAKNEIPFAFTAEGLEKPGDYLKNVRKAISMGLDKEYALKALTYNPAQFLEMENKLGSLENGNLANFLITSADLFEEDNIIYENWIKGRQYIVMDMNIKDIRGNYSLNINGKIYMLALTGKMENPKARIEQDTNKIKATVKQDNDLISIYFTIKDENYNGLIALSGKINYKSGIWDGRAQLPTGDWVKWSAIKQRETKKEEAENKKSEPDSSIVTKPGQVWYPNLPYGFDSLPAAETIMVTNATIWTNEEQGVLKNASLLIENGKITAVGEILTVPVGARIIDAKGKHITAGIIDEHSHIAISRGVNECTQAVTSEVKIGDVITSDDINIYRQLAGGVTAAQLLHGSCNPVGGQSAIIKLRWGVDPEAMKIEKADGFIKFALGENVKRSNFGGGYNQRFPQTRMGVEQVYYDAFTRAKEYEQEWKDFFNYYNGLKTKEKDKAIPPRKDLELDALVQILNDKRFISCHSYQQSEINMLMHVADSMGFKVNTFTHILEGYKVADKMKDHGVGGSTFSDWWAYKYEVNDAIPHNGAIMHQQGIVTAFNSDDAEMGRRLNQEAAKAVKYGSVSEEEALKFVTLNPAKLLHLDDRMGSIREGKDADIVIWSDHPLSIYAKAEQTYVDGICYYDITRDTALQKRTQAERARLIAKMLESKKNGEPTQKPVKKEQKLYHCDTVDSEY